VDSWPLLILTAFVASLTAAVVGTGGGVLLLPVLVAAFGVRDAIPMYAVAQLIGNISRVGLNWNLIDRRVVFWFSLGAVPAAILGAWLFTRVGDTNLMKILGVFLLLIAIRMWRKRKAKRGFPLHRFAFIGAFFSLVSALVGSAGPFLAPFYLSFGLIKGAFIGTEALGTSILHVVKLLSYQSFGAMSDDILIHGCLLGPVMIVGSFCGKWVVDLISTEVFLRVVEVLIVSFGIWFLIR